MSEEFGQFMKLNGIKHIKCSPYHPSSNGQAEQFVRTFKQAIRAGERESLPLDQRLQNFLFMSSDTACNYRSVTMQVVFRGVGSSVKVGGQIYKYDF